jgi:BstXI restriction endonuclease
MASLPKLLARKLYKAGQTRGADDDEIFQNRVLRTSTVLIPYDCWAICKNPPAGDQAYRYGHIVLISPDDYFVHPGPDKELAAEGLILGRNALVFYQSRVQWLAHNPDDLKWRAATSRIDPLGGQYVARIPANTAEGGGKINRGFTTTASKGAGIRVFEYANTETNKAAQLQLEALVWFCTDAHAVLTLRGMKEVDATHRKNSALRKAHEQNLLDMARLAEARIVNRRGVTTCPLCLEEISAEGFFNKLRQAQGRAVLDLTVTQLNLFHIEELRVGVFNHKPYNLGWGHHHCNVVVKDIGVHKTLEWMKNVLDRNALVAAAE